MYLSDTGYYMHEGVPADAPFLTPMAVLTSGGFSKILKPGRLSTKNGGFMLTN